jgi:hypothetical protein
MGISVLFLDLKWPNGNRFAKIEKKYKINHEKEAFWDRAFKVGMAAIFFAGIIAAPSTLGISLAASAYAVGALSYYTASIKALESSRNKENQAMRYQIEQVSTQNIISPTGKHLTSKCKNNQPVIRKIELVKEKLVIDHNNNPTNNTAGPKRP